MIDPGDVAGLSRIMLESTSDDMYRINAFRVLKLPVDAPQKQVDKRVEKFLSYIRLGRGIEEKGYLDLRFPIEESDIRNAAQRLTDPEMRLIDEFYWFWPLNKESSDDDDVLDLIFNQDYSGALNLWKEHAKNENNGYQAMASSHNLAVFNLVLALDNELENKNKKLNEKKLVQNSIYWRDAYAWWKNCIDNDEIYGFLSDRVDKLDDPRLNKTDIARELCDTLPIAIMRLNAKLALDSKKYDEKRYDQHIEILKKSEFDKSQVEKPLRSLVASINDEIKTQCESISGQVDSDLENGVEAVRRFLEEILGPLKVIDSILSHNDPQLEATHNLIANTVHVNLIKCINKTGIFSSSIDLLKLALEIARIGALKEGIRESIKRSEEVIPMERIFNELKEISVLCDHSESESEKYPQKADEISRGLIDKTKPLIKKIDNLLAENDEIRANIHDRVAMTILQVQLKYNNRQEGWKNVVEILEKARDIAQTQSVKEQIYKNLSVAKINNTRSGLEKILVDIVKLCNSSETESTKNPQNADSISRSLIDQTKPLLNVVDDLPPEDNKIKDDIHDRVAMTILQVQLKYNNRQDGWKDVAQILGIARDIARTQSVRDLINKNIDAAGMIDRGEVLCWFCNKNTSKERSGIPLKMLNEMTGYGGMLLVPRCETCKSTHDHPSNRKGLGFFLGMGVGLAYAYMTQQSLWVLIIAPLFLGYIVSALIGSFGGDISSRGVKPESYKLEYPTLKKLIEEGYEIEEKP